MREDRILRLLEKLFPHSLAPFEYNGLLNLGNNEIINHLGVTLGFSFASITKAIEENCDVLVIHNVPEQNVLQNDLYYSDIIELAQKNELSLYKLHLPLDFAKGGIIDQLTKIMQYKAKPTLLKYNNFEIYGGVYLANKKMSLIQVIKRVKLLQPKTVRIVVGKKKFVEKIAITSGDGCKPEFLLQLKPDVFICGLLNQETIRIANDLDISLIEATSYSTENTPLLKIVDTLRTNLAGVRVSFIDIKNDVTRGIL